MRAVLQRVSQSHVVVDGQVVGAIDRGLLVLVGVAQGDTEAEARSLADKVSQLRIFPDADGKMNLSVRDAGGAILAISQFTLLADCRKGRRPSFIMAAGPELARKLYETFCDALVSAGLRTERGIFQADMKVHLINDGPVTIVLDTNA